MSAVDPVAAHDAGAPTTAETVASFIAAFAMAAAVIALAWHPLRLLAPALVLSLLAAGIGGRAKGIAAAAVATVTVCFFFAMMIAVITSRPLW
jgi:hypothetical protein